MILGVSGTRCADTTTDCMTSVGTTRLQSLAAVARNTALTAVIVIRKKYVRKFSAR